MPKPSFRNAVSTFFGSPSSANNHAAGIAFESPHANLPAFFGHPAEKLLPTVTKGGKFGILGARNYGTITPTSYVGGANK